MTVGGTISQTEYLDVGKEGRGKLQRTGTLFFCILPTMKRWRSSTTCFQQHNILSKPMDQMTMDFILWSYLHRSILTLLWKIQLTQRQTSVHWVYNSITTFFFTKKLDVHRCGTCVYMAETFYLYTKGTLNFKLSIWFIDRSNSYRVKYTPWLLHKINWGSYKHFIRFRGKGKAAWKFPGEGG